MKRNRQPGICRAAGLALALIAAGPAGAEETKTPRDFYNQGVKQLAKNQLREAESSLRTAVQSNLATLQPVALYNLGHVRFAQGKETLKGSADQKTVIDHGSSITELALQVLKRIAPVVTSVNIDELVNAYMQGRAVRKRIRVSRDETTRELDLVKSALVRWERSSGDFRSAFELDAANEDAKFNADVVDRHIEELKKYKKQLEMQLEALSQARAKLKEMMKEMRGKIPKDRQTESDDEESDEDDEDEPEEKEEKQSKADKGQQKQRIGGDREIDADVLKTLKEKMTPKTMQLGQDPGGEDPRGGEPGGFRPAEGSQTERIRIRKGRDW